MNHFRIFPSWSAVVTEALDLLGNAEAAGAALSPSHRSRLESLRAGLNLFAEAEGL